MRIALFTNEYPPNVYGGAGVHVEYLSRELARANGGAHRVDVELVARTAGVSKVRRATPEFVREATGQPIGGVAPVGHPAPIRTLVDTWLQKHEVVWAAGGHPHTVFPTTFDELLRITGGVPVDVE